LFTILLLSLQANELFVGRVAMVGFAAAVIGQFLMGGLHGPGPVAQVSNVGSKHTCVFPTPEGRMAAADGGEW
jgi:hypothetical protein